MIALNVNGKKYEVDVDADTPLLWTIRDVIGLTGAVDCGIVVNPDTVRAQVESAIIFGIAGALYCEVTFKDGRVEQDNFHNYRVLRINETPIIDVHIVKSRETPGGMGEPGTSALAPAVTNAIFAARGKRIRKLPVANQAVVA